jgi:hypothetical protein
MLKALVGSICSKQNKNKKRKRRIYKSNNNKTMDGSRDRHNLSGRQVAISTQTSTVLLSCDPVIVLLGIHSEEIIRNKQRSRHKRVPWHFYVKNGI